MPQAVLDIANGMDYLHSMTPPIIHRDLKALNVLVTDDWVYKISDLGAPPVGGAEWGGRAAAAYSSDLGAVRRAARERVSRLGLGCVREC